MKFYRFSVRWANLFDCIKNWRQNFIQIDEDGAISGHGMVYNFIKYISGRLLRNVLHIE